MAFERDFKYVAVAIAVMQMATNDQDLVELWKGEKSNRDLLNLDPSHRPGLDLLEAFKARRNQLTKDIT